jgi:hypothetical protein
MSKILTTATAIAVLGLAATSVAQARGNFDRGGFSSEYYQAESQAQPHYTRSVEANEDRPYD